MLCESEYLVSAFDVQENKRMWFYKQRNQRRMTETERDMLRCIEKWQEAERSDFRELCVLMRKDLLECVEMTRYYLD